MKKKLIASLSAVAMVAAISTPVLASGHGCRGGNNHRGYGSHMMDENYSNMHDYMFDENGNILSQEDYEKNLDALVADKTLTKNDKQDYLDMYNNCVDNNWHNSSNNGSHHRGSRY
ncbi:MAG: hypothetical protein ACK5LT_01990 [Lachnospirales bacterium]